MVDFRKQDLRNEMDPLIRGSGVCSILHAFEALDEVLLSRSVIRPIEKLYVARLCGELGSTVPLLSSAKHWMSLWLNRLEEFFLLAGEGAGGNSTSTRGVG
eukprot:CAMPEP_0113711054 /NCGR_PEP_ID=MMETSP0038_2-20120614/30530_1 /TAXON_ID=2898 /ORGANISM="Cryptomonas paramecium" /LENGTH=100 /DNA_ID=CAMNT_0000637241 /DNA_START=158 /DNA_END=457 /DNA_ORIENTATION=+ /assembly_acc=CAM_ASM_000170